MQDRYFVQTQGPCQAGLVHGLAVHEHVQDAELRRGQFQALAFVFKQAHRQLVGPSEQKARATVQGGHGRASSSVQGLTQ